MFKYVLVLALSVWFATPAFAQRDAIDLSTAVVHNSPSDIANWSVTSRVETLRMSPEGTANPGLSMNFADRQRWPNYTPPGWDGPIQYTIWAGVRINGVWHVAGFMQMWRERIATGAPLLSYGDGCTKNNFACNWAYDGRWGAMAGYEPRAGEQMIFFASAGNARGIGAVTSVRQRTNVVMVELPANDNAVWNFPVAQTDLLIDAGAAGLGALLDTLSYTPLHALNPKAIATGNLDGSGAHESIVDFGTPHGVWVRWGSGVWTQLHPSTTTALAVGDIDRNGRDDVVISFPLLGLWAFMNGTSWVQLHNLSPSMIATVSTGTLVLDFPGYGLWLRQANGIWLAMHPMSATAIASGDFDGNGGVDIAVAFPGQGVWVFWNNGTWSRLNASDAARLTVGDFDATAADDLLIDFGPQGLWAWRNAQTWGQVHSLSSRHMTAADLDGNGIQDMVIDFGPGHGIWIFGNLTTWVQATANSTDAVVPAGFN